MTPPLPDLLPIRPFTRPARGSVTLPGSKSITNRALLLAALCDTPVKLTGALFSEDTGLMAAALRKLGFSIFADENTGALDVSGQANAYKSTEPVDLFVGLAGTTARFLTALCAAAPQGVYRLDGVPQMRKRPMRGLIDALRTFGADIRCTDVNGFFPLEIHARGLRGGTTALDASESSQLLSALLMVAPRASEGLRVSLTKEVRHAFVDMTLRMMAEFGISASRDRGAAFAISPAEYSAPNAYAVEPDATAASYFLALPVVVGGTVELPGLSSADNSLQGDAAFSTLLARIRSRPKNVRVEEDFHEISDTFLTLAAIAPLLDGPTRITGIAHTRKQETDRVAGMACELRKLGQQVTEEQDALTIEPRPLAPGVEIETYGDHRFAMSFAILGCHDLRGDGRPWLSIRNPACCAKTFPNFFDVLDEVWRNSHSSP